MPSQRAQISPEPTASASQTAAVETPITDAPYMRDSRIMSVRGRIDLFCEWFDVTPPDIQYEDGEEGRDGAILMTDEIFDWIRVQYAPMDWILSGDAKSLCALMRGICEASKNNEPEAA